MKDGYKECSYCGKLLPINYSKDICPNCEESMLFSNVKDYIRENNVNAFQVAEHFDIPLKKVKEWIKEGRIEYVLNPNENKYSSNYCEICKKKISFGTLCSDCQRLTVSNKGYAKTNKDLEKMRFFQ